MFQFLHSNRTPMPDISDGQVHEQCPLSHRGQRTSSQRGKKTLCAVPVKFLLLATTYYIVGLDDGAVEYGQNCTPAVMTILTDVNSAQLSHTKSLVHALDSIKTLRPLDSPIESQESLPRQAPMYF